MENLKKMNSQNLVQKQAIDIEALSVKNRILKEHLNFLREKIRDQKSQLDLFAELLLMKIS